MLKIFVELTPFFEDNYEEQGVREYAKAIQVSPPTASTILKKLLKEKLLKQREFKNNHLYRANRENELFKDLARSYWRIKLQNTVKHLAEQTFDANIILFGSLAKTENTKESDIDLFIDTRKQDINLQKLEKKLKRNIELHFKEELNNKNLKKNIQEGTVLNGRGV